mmetsp:Transcript_37663/g.83870  ORF Transcript_37663/g.83870 Transcript_37663/m.83870 type:complete len:117 (-) Transcript_37663:543-893(-)
MIAQRANLRLSQPAARTTVGRARLTVHASGNGVSTGAFAEGTRIKVTKPVKLYSVPKHPEGIDIEGMEGVVAKDITNFKGKVISANFPYVVKFVTQLGGADIKFQAHLGEEEMQAL